MSACPSLLVWSAVVGVMVLSFAGPAWLIATGRVDFSANRRTASREPTGIAPRPADHPDALIHVYSARASNWRGAFFSHSWIAAKPDNANAWTVYQIIRIRKAHGMGPPVVVRVDDEPDRLWYGQMPALIGVLDGPGTENAISLIETATTQYPWGDHFRSWPGPNSNTFVAEIARQVPALNLSLPVTAIGKDWLGPKRFVAPAPSNTGYQLSLFGVVGVLVARTEGIEFNLLGTGYGVDLKRPALKLPGIGRLGLRPVHTPVSDGVDRYTS